MGAWEFRIIMTKFQKSRFCNDGVVNIFVSGAAFRIALALAEVYQLTESNTKAIGFICILKVIEWNISPVISALGAS